MGAFTTGVGMPCFPYGIDAPIDPVQTPQKYTTIDRRSTDTELDELPARDHTVLS
jgi:hypothetical protein